MIRPTLNAACAMLLSAAVMTTALAADGPPRHPKAPPPPQDFYTHSGFMDRESQLGAAVMDAVRRTGPDKGIALEFAAVQQDMLGLAVARAIQVASVMEPYQHELNDGIVKTQLTALQFAKDTGVTPQMVDHEVKTQTPMLVRVGKLLAMGGDPQLGLIALTERTACFYQLVLDYERNGMTIRWKSPYGTVLAAGTKLGQFNLTEREVHENYTVPAMQKRAAVMGMQVSFSPWQEDGWITMTASMAPHAR